LLAYLVVATAFSWFIEPIRGKSYVALAAGPKSAAADQQPVTKADRLKSSLELPALVGLPAAGDASALQDQPERSVISRAVKKARRYQDASSRLAHVAHEQPFQQTSPAGFGWGSAGGSW
jgi:hypothetical protein